MKIRFCSIFWRPLGVLVLVAVAVGLNQEASYRAQRQLLLEHRLDDLALELTRAGQWLDARLQKPGELGAVTLERAVDAADTLAYVLVDERGAVRQLPGQRSVSAADINEQGEAFTTLLSRARESGQLVTGLAGDRVVGLYPVQAGAAKGTVLVGEDHFSQAFVDLDQTRFSGLAYLAKMLILSALLLFVLTYLIAGRRLARIDQALLRFSEGDPDSRTGLLGGDAIARLGQRFDRMAERMAAERRNLAESEERLKFALRGSDIGIWDWHLESGRTYYSPRWKSLLGYGEDELIAHAEEWLKRVHPDDLPVVMDRLKDHMGGLTEFFDSEHRLRCKDGGYLWVLERGVAIRNDQGVAVRMVGALSDISGRKDMEAALLRSKEEYRSVIEGVTQIIFRSDARGRLIFLNPAWTELTGFPMSECLSANIADYVHGDDRVRVMGLFRATAEGHLQTLACELRLICLDGRSRWFSLHARAGLDAEGSAIVAGVLSDLNAQKATEAALTRSNRERNAILSLSPDGFVFIDEDDQVAYVNPAFLGMTHVAADDVVGQNLSVLGERVAALCDPAKPLPDFAAMQDDKETTLCLVKPGKLILRSLVRNIPNDMGGLHGRVMFFRDVTQESEVDRIKSEFLSTAAHELRTPMASIFGFSELLLAREFDPATQRDLVQTIHRQTQNLINLVNELLDLARIEARGGKSFKILEQDLGPLLLNAVAAQYVPAATHRLELDLPKNLPKVRVDAEKFQQCLANVLSNAIKYSPQGGEIRVSAVRRKAKDGEQVGIAVRDQGIGMTAEQISHVFDRFFRADASGVIPGTGLGMSLVKEIMDIFHGEVAVASSPGEGTEVILWLPLLDVSTAEPN
ncbi:MAG: PAS domain S-box protein [Bacteroidota bacterium]